MARFNSASGQWEALGASLGGAGISGTGSAGAVKLVMGSGGVVAVWLDGSAGSQRIYARQFSGGAWVPIGIGSDSGNGLAGGTFAADVRDISVASDGSRIALAWTQVDSGSGLRHVYLRELSGGAWNAIGGSATGTGVSGIADPAVSGSISHNAQPSVAYFGGQLFVAWQAFADQGASVAVARYDNTPARTLERVDVFGQPGVPSSPQLSAGGDALRLLWQRQPLDDAPTDLYALRYNATSGHFGQELLGEASSGGLSETGGRAMQLALATDSFGRSTVVWQDAITGEPEIHARGMDTTVSRSFDALGDGSIQAILDTNDLGAGDVIVVIGTVNGNVLIAAQHAGVTIYGAPGSQIVGSVTVAADNVLLQRLQVSGAVNTLGGVAGFALTESTVASVGLLGGSNAQVTANTVTGSVLVSGAVQGALIDHNAIGGTTGISVQGTAGNGPTELTISHNTIDAGDVGIALGVAAQGRIDDNHIRGGATGLAIANTFSGLIADNRIQGNQVGVRYDAGAALTGNTVYGSAIGIRTTVAGMVDGLGFVAGSGSNTVDQNTTGIESVGAQFQLQQVMRSTIGVTGSGIVGGTSLDLANVVSGNTTGIAAFVGTVQYSRVADNTVGIEVTSTMNGLKIWHNVIHGNAVAGLRSTGGSDIRIYQNTFHAVAGDNIRLQSGSSNVEIQGNILWAESGYDIYVANDSQSGFHSDYNNLYQTGSGKLVYWTKDFVDVLDWQADVARYDLHSIGATVVNPGWARPQFMDVYRDDYRLFALVAGQRFSSPDVDASNVLLDQGTPPHYANLIANSGFESGLGGWTVNAGSAVKTGAPAAYQGSQYFSAGSSEQGFAEQSINLVNAGFAAAEIDGGLLDLAFGGRVRSASEAPRDAGTVSLIFLDAVGQEIRRQAVKALNADGRWELVGDRVTAPTGARFAVLRFDADRNSGSTNDAWFDTGFVVRVSDAYIPDLGAHGAGTHEAPVDPMPRIELRFPDLYTDWEKDEPLSIRWITTNNAANSPVRIDLLQDTADGPQLLVNLALATPDDGDFIWIPANSGIDFNTKNLRIQVSLSQNPAVLDRAQETFSVPEDGQDYFVDDQSGVGDIYTPTAAGSNRNTGKTAEVPKPNPVNVLRAYDLQAGDTLYIDSGDYPMIDPIGVSGSNDVSLLVGPGMGRDEGFTITGPTESDLIARLFPAIPGDRTRALIDLEDADFVTVRHLTLENAHRGVYTHGGSDSFEASFLTATGHAQEGFLINTASPFGDFDHLVALNNGAGGVVISGNIRSLTNSTALGNTGDGFRVTGLIGSATDNIARTNTDWGFEFSQSGDGVIQRNESSANRAGIYVSNNVSGSAVQIGDTDLANGNGNRVFDNRDGGIYAYYSALVAGNMVFGHLTSSAWGIYAYSNVTVDSNLVYDNTQGIYGWYGTIDRNRVYANTNDGIRAENTDVFGNVVYGNAVGLRISEYYSQPRTTRSNLVYGNGSAGVLIGGNAQTFINNTVYQTVGDAVRVANASNTKLFNNILGADAGYVLSVASNSQVGFESDYNLFLNGGTLGQWQGVDRASLAAWRGASFTDASSLVADPQFVDANGADNQLGFVSLAQDGRDDDFHLRSAHGGFQGGSGLAPVRDAITGLPVFIAPTALTSTGQSPAIDRGRASDPYANEPTANGGYINIGTYGNTGQAGRSPDQYITILNPNGGERIGQDSTVDIRWRSFGFTGNVNIAYRGGSASAFTPLGSNEANDGSFSWVVDAAGYLAGTNYEIRITSVDTPAILDLSDALFSVIAPITFYYVNDGSLVGDEYTTALGSDGNDGLSPDLPKASIRGILDAYDLKPGDVILVDTGHYTLGTNIFVLADDSGVTMRGAMAHETVLDRGNTNTGAYVFEFQGADDVTLESLQITGGQYGVYATTVVDSDRLSIVDSRVYGNAQWGVYATRATTTCWCRAT